MVREIDEKSVSQGRKIMLLLHNCPAHPTISYIISH